MKSDQLNALEGELRLRLPSALRDLYLETNGGIPVFASFANEMLETGIEFLSLEDARRAYRTLVEDVKVLSPNQFPFGVDPGGDYWVVNCDSSDGDVSFLQGIGDDSIVPTNLGLPEFLAALTAD